MDKQNVVYTHSGILFGFKRTEILAHARAWMKLEDTMLSEICQSQKESLCDPIYVKYLEQSHT